MLMRAKTSGDRSHPLKDRGADCYETPPEAVAALLKVHTLPQTIWECCCGPGSIVRSLRATGRVVYATDLVDYKSKDQDAARWDFLAERKLPIGVQAIVTNPPYRHAAEFVRKALDLCPHVVMLMRLAFLEAGNAKTEAGRARLAVLDGGHLSNVFVFQNRLPMMHRNGWTGNRSTNSIAFAWMVWNRDHSGPAALSRIKWKQIR